MSKASTSLLMLLSVFFFGLGVFFQSRLSEEGARDIASVKKELNREPNSKFDMKASNALKNCLVEKVGPGKIDLSKVVVDGRNWAIVSVDCVGESAKALYEAVAPYSTEQYIRYSDGRRGVARFFGRLYPPSQCVRVIRAARGPEVNLYSCLIRIDLDHELIENLKL
jgi:hypothetical protein